MTAAFQKSWVEASIPLNTPEDVARIIVGVAVDRQMSGQSVYVESGRGWTMERNLDRLEPQWLGESASANLARGQEFLGAGSKWH